MTVHPMFHETPSIEEHATYCFSCVFWAQFEKAKAKPTYSVDAYRLFADVLAKTIYRKHGHLRVGLQITCKEILDGLPETAQAMMGSLAPIVFQELGLRTTKDLDAMVQEAIRIRLFGYQKDEDHFSDYDVDLIALLRKPPELKGSQ